MLEGHLHHQFKPICDPDPLTNPRDRPFAKIRRAGSSFRFCPMRSHPLTCPLAVSHATPPEFFTRRSRTAVADKRTACTVFVASRHPQQRCVATLPASASCKLVATTLRLWNRSRPLRSEHPRRGCLGVKAARYGRLWAWCVSDLPRSMTRRRHNVPQPPRWARCLPSFFGRRSVTPPLQLSKDAPTRAHAWSGHILLSPSTLLADPSVCPCQEEKKILGAATEAYHHHEVGRERGNSPTTLCLAQVEGIGRTFIILNRGVPRRPFARYRCH
ncbi:hypothetical protein B0T14DRAFT_110821 [Immersiella caudata]|uniref:Uncharacterized protein n=1 Tax=Immersiella caudata TaxID=314043 RepID=A0AA39X3H6_9PEZI|nr:hypothetical protein B0T14DRAFT_110821 [Immersiella caudata]